MAKLKNDNIKQLRIKKGLTQEQAAEKCGVSLGTYYQWESGRRNIRPGNLMKLAEVLGCIVMDIYEFG